MKKQKKNITQAKSLGMGKSGRGNGKSKVGGKGKTGGQRRTSYKGQETARAEESLKTGRKRKQVRTWSVFIQRVQKGLQKPVGKDGLPQSGHTMSLKAMHIMNYCVSDIFQRILQQSSLLMQFSQRRTCASKHVMAACKLLMPGELAEHSIKEGFSAIQRFSTPASKGDKQGTPAVGMD